MTKYLLVSGSEKGRVQLFELLSAEQSVHVDAVSTGGEARRLLIENSYDIVVINTPLTDENGIELSCDIAHSNYSAVILLVKAEIMEEIEYKVTDYGVFVVGKPINKQLFFSAVKFVKASRQKINLLIENQEKLKKQIEDIKIVDRAKCCLIQYLEMTEAQAHRHIEKQAMDLRRSKRAVSEDILRTYE